MTTTGQRYQSDFARRYFNAGEVKAVLTLLNHRGVEVSDEHRAVIANCTDPALLESWLIRASTADKIQDLGGQFSGSAPIALLPRQVVMNREHEYQSDFTRRHFDAGQAWGEVRGEARGEARGKANAVLWLLDHRGVAVSDKHRAVIAGCTEHARLNSWILRAAAADRIQDLDDLFGE